jgi:hypothetical protein
MDLRKSIKKSKTIKMIKHKSKSLKSKSKNIFKKLSRTLKNNCNTKKSNNKNKRQIKRKNRSLKKTKLNNKMNNKNMLGGSNCDKYAYVNEPGLEINSDNGIPGIKINPARASIGEIKTCPTVDHPNI